MPANTKFYDNSYSRVFLLPNRAAPYTAAQYLALAKAGAFSWGQGDATLVRVPSSQALGQFDVVGKIIGAPGNPELPLTIRYNTDLSLMLKLAPKGCSHDFQVHMGSCKNPQDFNRGWDKILVVEGGHIGNYRTGELGALDPGERAVVNEEITLAGEFAYEVMPINFASKAASSLTQEVVRVVVCDSITCGLCGLPSDGCQVIFAVEKSTGGSPGIFPRVVYTSNGGQTFGVRDITSMTATEDPTDAFCVGTNLVVVAGSTFAELHYIAISDLVAGTGSWTKVTTGFSASGYPRKLWSASASATWFAGTGGYVYFSTDVTSGVTVQDAGSATAQQLNDITGLDTDFLVAVGNSNAIIYTTNGGKTWVSVTGPAVGVNLNAVYMVSANQWFVGTAGGKLFYTTDSGATWTEKVFPGSGAGVVYDIRFATKSVGYMAHSTATPAGRVLRTIDGGNTWYVLPEGSGSIPTNSRINDLAVCPDPNIVWGGGLATGTTGILVQAA